MHTHSLTRSNAKNLLPCHARKLTIHLKDEELAAHYSLLDHSVYGVQSVRICALKIARHR